MARVIVVGSINHDVTVTVNRFPKPGETLSGSSLTYGLGGKGANQAAAAARSGVPTVFIGAVGTDLAGHRLRTDLAAHGVDTSYLREVDSPSGTALITVSANGENTIILDAGANRAATIEPAKASLFPAPSDIVVLQAEIPAEANAAALAWAHSFGARVLLNLAPVRASDPTTLSRADILVVNESEAGLTLGLPAPATPLEAIGAAQALRGMGPRHVVVTLGSKGTAWASGAQAQHSPAITLGQTVDTTGAGDAFVGALAAALTLGKPFSEALTDGMRAGATAILAPGAASSYAALPTITRN